MSSPHGPLIRPCFLGMWHSGVPLDSHEDRMLMKVRFKQIHPPKQPLLGHTWSHLSHRHGCHFFMPGRKQNKQRTYQRNKQLKKAPKKSHAATALYLYYFNIILVLMYYHYYYFDWDDIATTPERTRHLGKIQNPTGLLHDTSKN